MPGPIRHAMLSAAGGEASFSIASRLFVDDASDSRPEEHGADCGLEHAVARATLDAWLSGLGSAESVGQAYAAVGDHVAQASRTRE